MTEVVDLDDHKTEWFKERGITNPRLIQAIEAVPRDAFLVMQTEGEDGNPVSGHPLPPLEVAAKLVNALDLKPEDRVLEVGTDSGYITAILSHMVESVYTVERRLSLAKLAEGRLVELDRGNVDVLHGARLTEYALNAPYDGILLSAVTPRVPDKLRSRLTIGGRLVVPVGRGNRNPEIICITRTGEDEYEETSLGQLRFTSLLGHILMEMGVADLEDIELAAMEADAKGQRLGQALVESARIKESDLIRALSIQRGLQLASVETLLKMADHELAYSVPRAFLQHHRILPLVRESDSLVVATVDPDAPAIELARILDAEAVVVYLVSTEDYERLWVTLLEGRTAHKKHEDNLMVRTEAKLESLLRASRKLKVTTLHFESHTHEVRVRMRREGGLRPMPECAFDTMEMAYLVEFFKINANLDVTEHRLPQRGQFYWQRDPESYHIGVQILPSISGEQVSIELLSEGLRPPTLSELGFSSDLHDDLRNLLAMRQGLVLVVGPLQCGKRTTLSTLLHEASRDTSLKVASIEKDVRLPLPNVHQTLIQPEMGFGYTEALRAFSTSDIDVLSIGEIPDARTALQALDTANQGHLVLSTLAGRSAVAVLQGLRELGIPSDILTSGLKAIISQRLVAKLCVDCREVYSPGAEVLAQFFPAGVPVGFKAYKGRGCAKCGGTGLRGRMPVVEILPITEKLQAAITSNQSAENLRTIALDGGFVTLAQYAVQLTREGMIPVEELAQFLPLRPAG